MNKIETSYDRVEAMLIDALGPVVGVYLSDPEVTDIMKNPDGYVWIKKLRHSEHINTGYKMDSHKAEQVIILVASIGKVTISKENRRVGAELPGSGNRFQGTLPPLVETPTFAIRKKASLLFTLEHYVQNGIMTEAQSERIKKGVWDHENILIGGGTGSGKTTLANAVLAEIAKTGERIIIIQDTIELQCATENKVEMRTNQYTTMDDLIVDSLRYFPKRIIVGEVRSTEALSLLDVWGTGHPGGLCTIHCNSAGHGLRRVERLVRRVSKDSQSEAIAETINLIVYIQETKDGRKVQEVIEVMGYDGQNYEFKKVA